MARNPSEAPSVVRPEDDASGAPSGSTPPLVQWFEDVRTSDVGVVGGKAASLGEMYQTLTGKGVRIPNGFATTVAAHDLFLDAPVPPDAWEGVPQDALRWEPSAVGQDTLRSALARIFERADVTDQIEMHGRASLARALVLAAPVPTAIADELASAHERLQREYGHEVDLAVRSSATREDSDMASFAGQYDSYLNVRGLEDVLAAWRKCCASAYTERAIGYQIRRDMNPLEGGVAVVVMKMVRSDIATSGVMFTLDPDSGNPNVVHVTSSYGLGELVVQGTVSPDTVVLWKEGIRRGFSSVVHRQLGAKDKQLVYSSQGGTTTESLDVHAARQRQWSLTREEAVELARMAITIEDHYGQPMDIEWAKDGYSGQLFIVQARPETVHSGAETASVMRTYRMDPERLDALVADGKVLARGHAVGTRIGSGMVRLYDDYEEVIVRKRELRNRLVAGERIEDIPAEARVFDEGDVLVTEMTTPDWEPLMKDASLIITEKGGRTSHAAIVAREFGIPAIVGCKDATRLLTPLMEVTGTCAEGDEGLVLDGLHDFEVEEVVMDDLPELRTMIKLNVGFPGKALADAMLPADGVGLARLEFILTAQVGIHPLALAYYEELRDFSTNGVLAKELEPHRERLEAEDAHELSTLLGAIERRTPGYGDRRQFFVDQVGYGVALICAAFHPRPVLVRLSDLKSNEYRDLLGRQAVRAARREPDDRLAWRGPLRGRRVRGGLRDGDGRPSSGAPAARAGQPEPHGAVLPHARRGRTGGGAPRPPWSLSPGGRAPASHGGASVERHRG
jgi:pyruvate, water dikinase